MAVPSAGTSSMSTPAPAPAVGASGNPAATTASSSSTGFQRHRLDSAPVALQGGSSNGDIARNSQQRQSSSSATAATPSTTTTSAPSATPAAQILRSPSGSFAGQHSSSTFSHQSSPHNSTLSPAYQPISLADVLAQSGGDLTRALDEVLAERNKFCLEAAKLSNENVRIWNLMGRIRKENEALKAARAHQPQSSTATPDRLATPPPVPQRRITNPDVARSINTAEDGAIASLPASPFLPGGTSSSRRIQSTSSSSPLSPSVSLPAINKDHSTIQQTTRSSTVSQNTSASSDRMSSQQDPQSPATMSADQASVMQQRLAARAMQQEQQRKATVDRASSSGDHHSQQATSVQDFPSTSTSSSSADARMRRNSAGSQDDYVAVDSNSTFDDETTTEPPTNKTDQPQTESPQPEHSKSAIAEQGAPASSLAQASPGLQRDRSRTITAARAAAAVRRAEQEAAAASASVSGDDVDNDVNDDDDGIEDDAGHRRFGSMGSSSHASDYMNSPPRVRRKDFGAMGLPTTPQGAASRNNSLLPSSDSFGSPRLRRSPSNLQPREATARGGGGDDGSVAQVRGGSGASGDGGGMSKSMSLTQALMAAAIEGPPEPVNYAPQPYLTNHLLKQTRVTVSGSNLRHNEKGREVISFFLLVELTQGGRTPQSGLDKWKIEKLYSDVLALDARIKHKHGKAATKKMAGANVQLPDKDLFKDHAPSKVDMRKLVLEAYLANLLAITLPDKDELSTFLCTDVVPMRPRNPQSLSKEGFLTKKGQNLGRWVTRFYVLDNHRLQHYDGRGGAILGTIQIRGAQIGRQQRTETSDMDENSYRHAFLILEKRPGNGQEPEQLVRHVLCADSDEERDEWVEVLVRCIADLDRKENGSVPAAGARNEGGRRGSDAAVQPSRYDTRRSVDAPTGTATAAAAPTAALSPRSRALKLAGGRERHDSHGTNTSSSHRGTPTKSTTPVAAAAAVNTAPVSSPTSTPRVKRSGSIGRRLRSRDGPTSGSGSFSHQDDGGLSNDAAPDTTTTSPPIAAVLPGKERSALRPSISGPMNGTPIPSGYKFGARDENSSTAGAGTTSAAATSTGPGSASGHGGAAGDAHKRDDKRRFWHRFGGGGGSDKSLTPRGEVRPVFGVPLTEAIAISSVSVGLALPSVVYRCIEYLEKKNAVKEEGIYRMSGSTADVKALRERFNTEGDVDLVREEQEHNGPSYDPHAIAGLLKSYLRELPTSVLTRDLHLEFMRVLDIVDRNERWRELGQLVSSLPLANYTLLRTLCKHLIKVISFQDVNKMTMRNVGIVFSPTLGVPAGLFSEFLTSFDYCFDTSAAAAASKAESHQQEVLRQAQTQPQQAHFTQQHRSHRNSMSYSEEEAARLMNAPLGGHRIVSAHPDHDVIGESGGEGGGEDGRGVAGGDGGRDDDVDVEADLDLLRTQAAVGGDDEAGAAAGTAYAQRGQQQRINNGRSGGTNGGTDYRHDMGNGDGAQHARYVGEARS